jgi:dynein heavy chain
VPNLFDSGDTSMIAENVRARAKRAGREGTRAELFQFFVEECRKNLRIALCFSPIGEAFRDRLRKFPSLVNCCTIDWFSGWPMEALRSVAGETQEPRVCLRFLPLFRLFF